MRTQGGPVISRISLLLVAALEVVPGRAANAQRITPSHLESARLAAAPQSTLAAAESRLAIMHSQSCDTRVASAVITGALVGAVVVLGVILADVRDVALDSGARPRNRTGLWVVGVGGGAVVGAIIGRRSCPYGRVGA